MLGFGIALRPDNLLFALVGSLIGTAVGVLPGIGPIAAISILLPLTFHLDATGAIIMLGAIYYGAMYGGTVTSVLMKVPGEAASAVTAIDGYEMAKQGRAGAALAIAAIGSFIGGTVATGFLVVAAPPLARVALEFGPPEFFGLMMVGMTLLIGFSGGAPLLGFISALFGLALSIPGTDLVDGTPRMTFGYAELLEGIEFVPVIMGLYGIGEILHDLEAKGGRVQMAKITSKMLSRKDVSESAMPIARGTAHRHLLRPHPRHRHTAADDHLVRRREARVQASGEVRRRRHRRGGRTRDDQQCVRERRAHSAVHAGRAGVADDCRAAGRVHDEWAHTRAVPVPREAGFRLGGDREPLCRQRDPARAQPPAGRDVGAPSAHSVFDPLSADHRLHGGRVLYDAQQPAGSRACCSCSASSGTSARRSDFPWRRWHSR